MIFLIWILQVILPDYGNEVAVKFGAIRHLPAYFKNIPGYALRVHLDVRGLIPMGGPWCAGWSTDACDAFRRYLSMWQEDNPIYYILRHPTSKVIQLDHFGQELMYDNKEATWLKRVALPGIPVVEADLMAQKLDSTLPLLKNLCRSIGTDVAYEVMTDVDQAYKFERAWDILIQRGVAIKMNTY